MVLSGRMKDVNSNNFGLLIAYIVPGFVCLWGISFFSETVSEWLGVVPATAPTVSGFLHATVAAVGAGLLVNAVRWHCVDFLHHASGIPRRNWDYSRLPERIEAFQYLVINQFRYYEFYANTLVASTFSFLAWVIVADRVSPWLIAGFAASEFLLWSASRRTLANYHLRIESFLGRSIDVCDLASAADSTKDRVLITVPTLRRRWSTPTFHTLKGALLAGTGRYNNS